MGYFEGLLCSPRETLAYARIYANPIFFKTSHESSERGISSSSLEPIDQMNIERLKAQIPHGAGELSPYCHLQFENANDSQ